MTLPGVSEQPAVTMHWLQVLKVPFRKGRDVPGATEGTRTGFCSGVAKTGTEYVQIAQSESACALLRPSGSQGLKHVFTMDPGLKHLGISGSVAN